ncbi:MAG: PEP-CTERM sorting domain-containing protein [Phycisphaerae bacterium]
MSRTRAFAFLSAALAGLVGAGTLAGAVINVPNGSFEEPYVDMVSPYATSEVAIWQKAPVPAWWLGLGYSAQQWNESVGTFVNVPFAPIDNVDGRQAVFMFATPDVELFQELDAVFEPGFSYRLTVAIEGGGFGMKLGVPMEIRLYYRDGDQRVTVGATEVTNANSSGVLSHLTDHHLDVPAVMAGDPWAGRKIGVQLISTVGLLDAGGYWDIDNVRLTAVPEPAALLLFGAGAAALLARRRARA